MFLKDLFLKSTLLLGVYFAYSFNDVNLTTFPAFKVAILQGLEQENIVRSASFGAANRLMAIDSWQSIESDDVKIRCF